MYKVIKEKLLKLISILVTFGRENTKNIQLAIKIWFLELQSNRENIQEYPVKTTFFVFSFNKNTNLWINKFQTNFELNRICFFKHIMLDNFFTNEGET